MTLDCGLQHERTLTASGCDFFPNLSALFVVLQLFPNIFQCMYNLNYIFS